MFSALTASIGMQVKMHPERVCHRLLSPVFPRCNRNGGMNVLGHGALTDPSKEDTFSCFVTRLNYREREYTEFGRSAFLRDIRAHCSRVYLPDTHVRTGRSTRAAETWAADRR